MVHCIDDPAPRAGREIPWCALAVHHPRRKLLLRQAMSLNVERTLLALASLLQLNISECDHQQN